MALISLGTLVVACRQVAVSGGRWKGSRTDGGIESGMHNGLSCQMEGCVDRLQSSITNYSHT